VAQVLNAGVGNSEPDGFREFVDTSSRALLRTAWLLTGEWASAEDLVQTALAVSWGHWSAARQQPAAYTRRVMARTWLRWRRRRWTGELASARMPERLGADPADGIEARQDLLACLSVLTVQQRAAVVFRYFADLSPEQTAAAMGCSVGAVKSHTARALARLRAEPAVAAVLRGGTS
jgi:RNA polymerase sigma-70 factor (sigma-E family)